MSIRHVTILLYNFLLKNSFCLDVCSQLLWVFSALLAQLQIAVLPHRHNQNLQLELILGKRRLLATMFSGWGRDQPSERERENISSGEKLIEPVDFYCIQIPQLITNVLTPWLCVFFFKYPKHILALVYGAHWIETLGLRSQTLYMCLSTAVRPVFPQ